MLNFDDVLKDWLKDPEFKAEYDRLQPEYALIQAVLDARIKKKLTQKNTLTNL